MAVELAREITGPANWRGPDMQKSTDWVHRFSAAEIAEIDAAMRGAKAAGRTMDTLDKSSFPLPTLERVLARARDYLEEGAGLFLFRGIPVQNYSKDELRYLFWGLGKHMGTAVPQSAVGDVLGDVRNIEQHLRIYTSNHDGAFHGDACDTVGLFVIQTAKSGGLSRIVSVVAVRNEIARRRPDLLRVLYEPFHWSWMKLEPPGFPRPYFLQPVFSEHEGRFSSMFIRQLIERGQALPGVPPLTPLQVEALDMVESVADDPALHFSMMFEPGDIQFLNNHLCIHARTAFEDHPEIERRRHLLRLWISPPNNRALSPLRGEFWKTAAGTVRGGFAHGSRPIYQTIPDDSR